MKSAVKALCLSASLMLFACIIINRVKKDLAISKPSTPTSLADKIVLKDANLLQQWYPKTKTPADVVQSSADLAPSLRWLYPFVTPANNRARGQNWLSPFVPTVSAVKTVAPLGTDLGSPGPTPGDMLRYTVVISNSTGAMDANGVQFSDQIDANTTLVPNSLKSGPIAVDDAYATVGNISISVPSAAGLMNNDVNLNGTPMTVTGVNTTGTSGDVTFNANGSFTFNPSPGFEGTTTFDYTVNNGFMSATGTVTITVTGMIWYLDDNASAPGDGRLSSPFSSIANFNSIAADDPNDNIFLYSGTYSGAGFTLLNGQNLIGQGTDEGTLAALAGVTFPVHPPISGSIPTTGGTNPTITHSSTAITTGENNEIYGVTINNSGGSSTAFVANNFVTLKVRDVILSNDGGTGINFNNGALDVIIQSVSVSNTSTGIFISNTTGSFQIPGTGTTDGSGGTFSNISGRGIELRNVTNITLKNLLMPSANTTTDGGGDTACDEDDVAACFAAIYMNVANTVVLDNIEIGDVVAPIVKSAEHGIVGLSVSNLSINNCLASSNGNNTDGQEEDALKLRNLSGTCSITNSTFEKSAYRTADIRNTTGTLNLTVSGCTFDDVNSSTVGQNLFELRTYSTANATVNISNCLFRLPGSQGAVTGIAETGSTLTFNITTSTIDVPTANGGGIELDAINNSTLNYNINGNTKIQCVEQVAFLSGTLPLAPSPPFSGTLRGRVNNNTLITASHPVASAFNNVRFAHNGGGTMRVELKDNASINSSFTNASVQGVSRLGSGSLDLIVTGNTITATSTSTSYEGISTIAGDGSSAGQTNANCTFVASNSVTKTSRLFRAQNLGPGTTINLQGTGPDIVANWTGNMNNMSAVPPMSTVISSGTITFGGTCTAPAHASLMPEAELLALVAPRSLDDEALKQTQEDKNTTERTGAVAELLSESKANQPAEMPAAPPMMVLAGETVTVGAPSGFLLPAGKQITIQFDVTINTPLPAGVCQISNQGSVSGSNFSTILTDNVAGGSVDPTVTQLSKHSLGNLVYKDNNKNGSFDGMDAGVNGVVVNLYRDNGSTAGILDAGDSFVTFTTTAGGGIYTFADLCSGDYIVQIPATEFGAGKPLEGLISSPVGAASDPDDDTNNDDNGQTAINGSIASQAITLTYAGSLVENNNTLDLGFKTPTNVNINNLTLFEGSGGGSTTFDFTVTRDDNSEAFSLNVNTGAISTNNGDYTTISGGTVSFTAGGSTTATVSVTVTADDIVELAETFNVLLSNAPAGVVITDGTGLGTITNDDQATLSINSVSNVEGNSSTQTYTFTVTSDKAVDVPFTVNVATTNGTATTGDNDYVTNNAILNFAGTTAGEIQTFNVTVNGDMKVEPNETFTVPLSSVSASGRNVVISGANGTGTGTINNDDAATISIDNVSLAEGNAGNTNFIFTVSLNKVVSTAVTVNFTTANGTAGAGDYNTNTGMVTFPANGTGQTQTITVQVIGDVVGEANETFFVNLTSIQGNPPNITFDDAQGLGTILDDDLSFSINDVTKDEGNAGTTSFTFTVTRSSTATAETIDFTIVDGTAKSADNDFTSSSPTGTLSFAIGDNSETITVDVNSDTKVEANETFFVNLSNVSNGSISDAQGKGTINNDDAAVVHLQLLSATKAEGNTGMTNFTFTATLNNPVQDGFNLAYTTDDATATTANNDYQDNDDVLSFTGTAGEQKIITVLVNGDTDVEADETFTVSIEDNGFSNTNVPLSALTTASTVTATIQNDDSGINAGNDTTICAATTMIQLKGTVSGAATAGTWTTSGTGTFIPNANDLNAKYMFTAADTAAGVVNLTLTGNGPSGEKDIRIITLDPESIVNAGPDQTICAADTIYLSATLSGLATNLVWQKNAAFGTFVGSDTSPKAKYVLNGTGMLLSSLKFGVMSNDPGGNVCQGGLDTVQIFINPKATVDAGPNRRICASQDTVQLKGTIGGEATTATWSGGTGAFTPSTSSLNVVYTFTAADTAANLVKLYLTTDDPTGLCGPAKDSITIIIDAESIVNAGPDQTICAADTIYLNATLSGLATNLVWQKNAAFGTFVGSDTSPKAKYVLNGTGMLLSSLKFGVMSNDPGGNVCQGGLDTVQIFINPKATVDAGPNRQICASQDTVQLKGTIGGAATTATWSGGTGAFTPSTSSLNVVYTFTAADTAANVVKLYLTTDDPTGLCGPAKDSITIIIDAESIVNAGPDQTICAADTIYLSATLSGLATNLVWQKNAAFGTFVGSDTRPEAKYVLNSTGMLLSSLKFGVMSNDPGGNVCQGGLDTVQIFINPKVTVNAGVDTAICPGSALPLNGQISGGTSNTSGTWTTFGTGTFTPNANTIAATYQPSPDDISAGTVILVLSSTDPSSNACSDQDSLVLTFRPQPTVTITGDTITCDEPAILTAVGDNISAYKWSTGESAASITVNAPGVYAVTVTNTQSPCKAVDSVKVIIGSNPTSAISISAAEACEGFTDTVRVKISASGGEGPYDFYYDDVIIYQHDDCTSTGVGGTYIALDTNNLELKLVGLQAGTYKYTVGPVSDANGCVDTTRRSVTLTVHPKPIGESLSKTISNCNPVDVALQPRVKCNITSTFKWYSVASVGSAVAFNNPNVLGETVNPAGTTSTITDVLTNTSAVNQTIIYRVEATSDKGCAGDPFYISVTVKPKTKVNCLACMNNVKVTLDKDCRFLVKPDHVMDGFSQCENGKVLEEALEVIIKDGNSDTYVDCAGTYDYVVLLKKEYENCFDFTPCWGTITAEDKTPPALICAPADITLDCYDVNYVLNNRLTIGNRGTVSSPRATGTTGQTIENAEGVAGTGDNCQLGLEPPRLEPDNIKNLGYAYFRDNCRDCGCRISLKWTDKAHYYACTDPEFVRNGYYAKIEREWVATDCNGMTSTHVQNIYFTRPVVKNGLTAGANDRGLRFRGNGTSAPSTDLYDWIVEYTACSPDKSLIKKADVMPSFCSFFNTTDNPRCLFLDEVECNFSVQIKDTEFPVCEGKGVKIDREIYVFDWCKGGIVDTFHVLIKIGDFQAPTITAKTPITVSTGPMNCTASIPTTRARLKTDMGIDISDNCSVANVSVRIKTRDRIVKGIVIATNVWEEIAYPVMNGVMSGLPIGRHRIIIDAYDGCYNASRDSFLFDVVDKIAPVMKCDDKLTVSLSNAAGYLNGYARVTAKDIDEGSFDNCELKWIKVRRTYNADCKNDLIAKGYDLNADGELDDKDGFTLVNGKWMTPLSDAIEFFCCDVSAEVTIELWGEDWSGNRNYCWMTISLEDKIAPQCLAPENITIDCDNKRLGTIDSKTQSALAFGDVIITSGNDCVKLDTVYTVVKKLKCGYGTIERIWTLTKTTSKGKISTECKQLITIRPVHEYDIRFPVDVDQRDCVKPIIDTLLTDELFCDILAVNITDKRYDASNDECYKIFRTYTVINWCAYDDKCGDPMAAGNVYVVDRKWTDNGRLPVWMLVRDRNRDGDEEFFLSRNRTPREGDLGDGLVSPIGTPTGVQNDEDVTKYMPYCKLSDEYYHSFMYTQIIKVYDDVAPVISFKRDTFCTSPVTCVANVKIPFTATDNCTDRLELERTQVMVAPFQTLTGPYIMSNSRDYIFSFEDDGKGKMAVSVTNLPEGLHDLIVVVRDECGNLTRPTRIPFLVRDCKAPAPICINGLSTELMPVVQPDGNGGGMMAVWANDFIASKIYDCNGQGPETQAGLKLVTKYSINRVGQPVKDDQTGLTFTCADKGKVINVEIHAWDEKGNHDFCVTFIEIQDNRKVCPSGGTGTTNEGEINGLIATDDAKPVASVEVAISGDKQDKGTTPNSGLYGFNSLLKGGDFTITPQLDKEHRNGVSTFDLILIQKHILGIQVLSNPYRMIAADVNGSKTITTLDLIQIRKLILNIDESFKSSPSWKFVDAKHKFEDERNPWRNEIPAIVNVNDLEGKVQADFIAIKMGDVNGNAATIPGVTSSEVRSGKDFILQTDEQEMKAGQIYDVLIKAKDLQKVQGFQFTLGVENAEIVGIDYGILKAENLGVFAKQGMITASWNTSSGGSGSEVASTEGLFTLKLRATKDHALSEVLNITSRLTAQEAYGLGDVTGNEVMDLKLSYNKGISNDQARLEQNQPNPFAEETLIGFYLPKAASATLTIRDVKGALIYRTQGDYAKGVNQVKLGKQELKAAGVLYYTLETEDFTATKKMVVLTR